MSLSVTYENLLNEGVFEHSANIETVTVGAGATIKRGTIMGKIGASGKYITSLAGASDGSQTAVAILAEDVTNTTGAPVDVKALLFKSGSFNTLGITFGTGHTIATVKDSLHAVSINITQGVA
jgi:hypothetical protein